MKTRIKNFTNFFNKLLVFYNSDAATYWHTITSKNIIGKPETLGKYYLDFSTKINYPGSFDNNGIPLYTLFNGRIIYHPIVICQYALGVYEHVIKSTNDKAHLDNFIKQADWLLSNIVMAESGSIWQINFDIPDYGIKGPWYSALSQGEAISVLCRAFMLTGRNEYLETAEKAMIPFTKPVSDGGLVNYFNGIAIYEEYPSPLKTVAVLNGFMFSIFGLFDLFLTNKNQLALELFSNGIISLKKILPYYDLKFWSRYYLFDYPKKYFASYTYHCIMLEQLKVIYLLTGDELFYDYSIKWESYTKSILKKSWAVFNKIVYAKTPNI